MHSLKARKRSDAIRLEEEQPYYEHESRSIFDAVDRTVLKSPRTRVRSCARNESHIIAELSRNYRGSVRDGTGNTCPRTTLVLLHALFKIFTPRSLFMHR
ncbi:hypothetical protein PUN28_002462 [Cardiocondyla obscurior]|uniref:Uncharacterized protein n=1 Tax=Cardiocondyla obscurior TaxID=286306 RepID=A0AAW2GUH6_9HYME